jgi:hypothetical protein
VGTVGVLWRELSTVFLNQHQRRDDREVLRVPHQDIARCRCNQCDAPEEEEEDKRC